MAPSNAISSIASQQLLAQAAQELAKGVRETGNGPNDFAKALLELIEVSTKVQEFEDMAAAANCEPTSQEAKTWQEISQMTLQYCKQNVLEQQQKAIKAVQNLAQQGATLYKVPVEALPAAAQGAVPLPPAMAPPSAPTTIVQPKESVAPSSPATPPGVWAMQAPPGLAPPPGLEIPTNAKGFRTPPGLEVFPKLSEQKAKPARKAAKPSKQQKSVPQAHPFGAILTCQAAPATGGWTCQQLAMNLEDYSDCDSD